MTREITNAISTSLDIYNCAICLFMILSLILKRNKTRKSIYFGLVCLSVFFFNLGDMSNWISEGLTPAWHVPFLHVMTFVYYLFTPLIVLFLVAYIREYLMPFKVSRIYFHVTHILCVIYAVGVIVNLFTGWFYYISSDNYYHRGPYAGIAFAFFVAFFLMTIWITIANWKYFDKKALVSFLSYSFIPTVMEAIQMNVYGLSLVNTGMTFSILLIFMNSHMDLEKSFELTTNEVQTQERKLINFQEHTIISLSNLVENRDTETGEHARRTSLFVEYLAQQTMKDGFYTETINNNYIKLLVKAAPMHDIGKIVVSDTILKKPGKLTPDEYEKMKLHAEEGGRIVSDIIGITDDKDYINVAKDMAQSHHERWDGSGYPHQLKGEEIPLSARLMAIADVFDALVFERCYKKPLSPEEAYKIIIEESGTHFDPILVQEFIKVKPEIIKIVHIFQD